MMPSPLPSSLLCMAALGLALNLSSCYPPQMQYPYTPMVSQRRATLKENLLKLLPADKAALPEAQEEAQWLADTAYKAGAGISRVNGSHFPGWSGNALINSHLQDRGLCWHYQHDLYRELRRRPLNFFRLGCCVRDKARSSEHNCVYVAEKSTAWPAAWVLDAWMWNGRLKVNDARELDPDDWSDLPDICHYLELSYPVQHSAPVEHWAVLRGKSGDYCNYNTEDAQKSSQYVRMLENIAKGRLLHPNKPTNY